VPTVVLLHTCLVNEFSPEVGFAVLEVLERIGYDVAVPAGQTCCGQPAFNAGFHDAARVAARHTLSQLMATDGPIIIPSGSCGDMLTHQYAALFADDEEWRLRAHSVAVRTVEFSAFVAAHLERLPQLRLDAAVTYHPSCHLARGLGIQQEPRRLIDSIAGIERRVLPGEDDCCGFGGLFSVKYQEISQRMLDRKLDHVAACAAGRVVSCDMGCLLHMSSGLRRRGEATRVQHIAELLAEALK
jgi:L-lactate dehydrogenase complex protein LldE